MSVQDSQMDLISGGMRIGYARVSTMEQKLDLQIDALQRSGCSIIYTEKVSGTKKDRPELENALKALRAGDTLVVWRLDRLGRSLSHLIALIEELRQRNVQLESITENINTSQAVGLMCVHIFAVLAEFEKHLNRERTHEGLAAARARGRKGGRKRKLSHEQVREASALLDSGKFTVAEVSKKFSVSRPTLLKAIKELQQKKIA